MAIWALGNPEPVDPRIRGLFAVPIAQIRRAGRARVVDRGAG